MGRPTGVPYNRGQISHITLVLLLIADPDPSERARAGLLRPPAALHRRPHGKCRSGQRYQEPKYWIGLVETCPSTILTETESLWRNEVNTEETVDSVFSTVPLPYVPRMIPDLPQDYRSRFESIQNMGVVCVIFRLRRGVSRNFWLNVSDESMEIPGIIEFSNLRPLNESIVYVPYYMPRDYSKFARDNEFFIAEAKQYIKQLNPEITDSDFIAEHASRYGYAQPVCQPGFSKVLPPIKTAIKGLYIADTSYYYPEDRSISESVNVGKQMANLANDI